ncbi:MAG: PAS domain-containing protein [Desulfuromonadales bacterium]|nr:PAS domain-containing protein [Desulfuromonadales bacterium]MBN2792513.1 PAS domain-containing protein [Desulfuromonadales bacterium]
MKSYFATPERTNEQDLKLEIDIASQNPVMSGLLHSVSGLLAILDEHRQIVAFNDSFLRMLGVDNPTSALGLRYSEALDCVHSEEEPAGCGTTKHCSSCGAAIAIVSSLKNNTPTEKVCALSAKRGGKELDIALLVKASPITIDGKRFLLIFLQDITQQQQRAALERTFFHDVNNMLFQLLGTSELLVNESPTDLARSVRQASLRLTKEIAIQRCLSENELSDYLPAWTEMSTVEIMDELNSFFTSYPAARDRKFIVTNEHPEDILKTDSSLLLRVLCNMITNVLEATEKFGTVRIWLEKKPATIDFHVWNSQESPESLALRIFQRNFSTKEQAGRGIGTYSMKLLGEKILGGQVSFSSSAADGTTFTFSHPI